MSDTKPTDPVLGTVAPMSSSNSSVSDAELAAEIKKKLSWQVLLFVGPPLAGKGTQAARLSELLGIPAVSSGDLFRNEAKSGSELGIRMKEYMDRGELIPNDLTTTFLTKKLGEPQYEGGFILDGYPRNPSHLAILDSILADLDRKIFASILFDVPKAALLARVEGRRVCAQCGAIHNISLMSADAIAEAVCTRCATPLAKRKDDSVDVFARRLQVYEEETLPLIPLLEQRNLLIRADVSSQEPAQVSRALLHELAHFHEPNLDALDAYRWLQFHEQSVRFTQDEAYRLTVAKQYIEKALYENRFHRSGILRRFIFLQTAERKKYLEHLAIFERFYGIEVLQVPPELEPTTIRALLEQKAKNQVPLAVVREETQLLRPGSNAPSSLNDGVRAVNVSRLLVHQLTPKKEVVDKVYEYRTNGRIDMSQRRPGTTGTFDVYGWDDVFRAENCEYTYHQMRERGIKNSSRDMVISDFLRESIYYKDLMDVAFNKQNPKRVIDFSVSVSDFVAQNKYYNNSLAVEYGYRNLQTHVLNFGVFFRAAQNRRQNNYWNPGLNGGIPLTKKADEIHELTFMAHDFGHFTIPDLTFIGNNSVRHRRAYIAWRMASEATTMALADMLFVDSLQKTGVEYDFATRRIYPLFVDLHKNFLDKENYVANLKKVVHANYEYCLRGDDGAYRELLRAAGSSDENLEKFKEKFMPFFVEDFHWTEKNYDNMQNRAEEMRRWWAAIEPLRKLPYLKIKSIDDFLVDLGKSGKVGTAEEFIEQVFEAVFEDKIRPVLEQKAELLPEKDRLHRAFARWMAGQLAICSKFHFIPDSAVYQAKIIEMILATQGGATLEDINKIRATYEEYLQKLVSVNVISKDDQATFAEVFPLFDPYFVSYDKGVSAYEDLRDVSKRIFSLEVHLEKQVEDVERILGRNLDKKEKAYHNTATILVEESGGNVERGLFVSKPGVIALAETHWSDAQQKLTTDVLQSFQVTFLLSGVSVETSLELVAHKEATVARLTSSKTNAMNLPLYRVQGLDVWAQKRYIEQTLRFRENFEKSFQPRTNWTDGNEIFNQSEPATKCTHLCYTMTLRDFHSLFIGRMGPDGNEAEVREVVHRMAEQLHTWYPQVILAPEEYLRLGNAAKYQFTTPSSETSKDAEKGKAVRLAAATRLTPAAIALFDALHIHRGLPHYAQLSEFRARITYLAFPTSAPELPKSVAYLKKMIEELSHLSVIAASQAVFLLRDLNAPLRNLLAQRGTLVDADGNSTLAINLKDLHAFLIKAGKLAGSDPQVQELVATAHEQFPLALRDSAFYIVNK